MASNAEVIRHQGNAPQTTADHGESHSDTMGSEVTRTAELGVSTLEAQARAMIQARFYLARQPGMMRNWDNVEQRLRKECARPGFANSAWWVLPLGSDPKKYPAGLSIRFAEAALRMAGNIDVEQMVVSDDQWKRTVRIRVMDLETNFGYTSEIVVDKTVERSDPKGREVLSYRQNSYNKMTYLVAATEQELAMKQNSAVSKAIRTSGLRLIPGDILDECRSQIVATRKKGADAEDPETARKQILDNFADLSVMPTDIAKFIGHDTSHFLPADREMLRGVYVAVRNGDVTWKEVLEARFGPEEGAEESAAAKKLKDQLERRKPGAATSAATGATSPSNAGTTTNPDTAKSSEPTPSTAQQQPTTTEPPADLADLEEFPDGSEPEWVKVKGVVYRMVDTGYKAWEKPGASAARQRKPLSL